MAKRGLAAPAAFIVAGGQSIDAPKRLHAAGECSRGSQPEENRPMAVYNLQFSVNATNIKTIERMLKQLGLQDVSAVAKVKLNPSRADRLSELISGIEDAKSEIESLAEEMGNWYDSMPENLQSGDKASQIESAKDTLENVASELDSQIDELNGVEFPSMMG